MNDFALPVRFYPKPGVKDALVAAARQLDAEDGFGDVEPQDDYSFAQALTLVLHNAPERLHEFLSGWVVESSWERLAEVDA